MNRVYNFVAARGNGALKLRGSWIAIAALAVVCSAPATATTYIGNRTIGEATAKLAITTDGTLGPLATANITSWNITLADSANTFTFSNADPDAQLAYIGGLSATQTTLDFDFAANVALFGLVSNSLRVGYCVSSRAACSGTVGEESFFYFGPSGSIVRYSTVGPRTLRPLAFAQTGVIPEPATWAMLIAGFGLVGAAARRRRIATTYA
jgi:hypothetical protein